MKETLVRLFLDTLEESSLARVMASKVARRGDFLAAGEAAADIASPDRILVAGIGKAAGPMCEALMPLLPAAKTSVVVVAADSPNPLPTGFRAFVGGHPYPNEQSGIAARCLLERASGLGRGDLLVCLLSGGGSAICEAPLDPSVSLGELRAFNEVLVTCGANIVEMNILRKHLSCIKGGRLAAAASPARQLTLYVSDVPPGQPSTVASGPTMPDESTCADAYATATRLGIASRLPSMIRKMFEGQTLEETPKPGSKVFDGCQWVCLLDNADALDSLESKSRGCGWVLERDLSVDDAPVELAADTLLDRLQALAAAHPGHTVAVTTGGELSSPVKGDGMGGRNQAFVLWAARKLADRGVRATVLSAGTDGIDGNSPAAGAVADEKTVPRARALGLDAAAFERRSDSYRFFKCLDDLVVTGPTGNNVRDLRIVVAQPG
jgi:hydroxypyruvate reductase